MNTSFREIERLVTVLQSLGRFYVVVRHDSGVFLLYQTVRADHCYIGRFVSAYRLVKFLNNEIAEEKFLNSNLRRVN